MEYRIWTPGPLLPEDKGPAPDQKKAGRDAEAAYETGGMLLPEVAPDFRDEVRKLLGTYQDQRDRERRT